MRMERESEQAAPAADRPAPPEELVAAAAAVRRGVTGLAARARSERGGVLSLNQTAVLGRLHRCGAMTPGEIAHRLHMRPQALTRTFAALEEHGWTRRVPDPSDGRQSLLSITPAGYRALAEEMRPRDVWLAGAMAEALTPVERDLLVLAARLLERLADVDAAAARSEA
jgi:DNA-binding MarR family transcriptional regulator